MARVGGINIPDNKHVDVSLTSIFGIGRKTAQDLCDKFKIPYSKKVSELSDEELDKLLDVVLSNLTYFLDNVGHNLSDNSSDEEYIKDKHNFYCKMQKQNPHTPRVMESLGVEPALVRRYIETCLFPEVS